MTFRLTTPPIVEPVTLQQTKDHLRVDDDMEDALISELIKTAREHCEVFTNRPLITQSWTYYGECFYGDIELKPNLQSVESVKYIDNNGIQQEVDVNGYMYDRVAVIGMIFSSYNMPWPYARNIKNSIEIEFICGYGLADDVPSSIKSAMLLLIGHWYVNRESVIVGVSIADVPQAVEMLLNPYRVIYS